MSNDFLKPFAESIHGRDCRYFSSSFSHDLSFYSLNCRGPALPYSCICRTEDNQMLEVYDDNAGLQARLEGKRLPEIRMMEVLLREYMHNCTC